MNFSRRIICFAVALGLASVTYCQDVMSLKECMQYAVEYALCKIRLNQDLQSTGVHR